MCHLLEGYSKAVRALTGCTVRSLPVRGALKFGTQGVTLIQADTAVVGADEQLPGDPRLEVQACDLATARLLASQILHVCNVLRTL